MKKLLLGLSALIVFFALLTPHSIIFAKENSEVNSISSNPQGATKSAEKIEYALPYPGILPDNPLYFLKALRDRIIGFLITDQLKKAEFNLLTSDKRIYAALLLSEKGKDQMTVDTLSKSNNYFHNALSSTDEAKKVGKNADIVLHNLELSVQKHKEALLMIEKKIGKKFDAQLQYESGRLEGFEKNINEIKL